jgi:hypothetical protein
VSADIESVTTRWRFVPPIDCEKGWRRKGAPPTFVRVHLIERTVYTDEEEPYWIVKGQPLTTKGNVNGGINWRQITDADMERLKGLVLT